MSGLRAAGRRAVDLSAVFWLTAAALACGSCGTAGGSDTVGQVQVGLLVPLSGPDAAAGQRRLHGAQLAVDLLNQHRMVNVAGTRTARFVLRPADTAGDSDRAQEQAARLANAGVAGLVSADDAEDTQRAAPAAQDHAVPLISAVASADYLGELAEPVLFRTCPDDSQLAQAVIGLVTQSGNTPRIGVISTGPDDADAVASLTDRANAAGVPVSPVDSHDGDTAAAVRRLLADRPDLVVAVAPSPTAASELLSGLAHRGVNTVVGLGAGFSAPEFTDTTPAALLRPVPWSADASSHNQLAAALAAAYQNRYHTPAMTSDVAETIAAVLVLATGVGQAHSATPTRITQALAALNLDALSLPVPFALGFDAVHNNTRAGAVIEQLSGGSGPPRSVYPPELASTRPAPFTPIAAAIYRPPRQARRRPVIPPADPA